MSSLPSGTATFLFTDIEGSTKPALAHPKTWEDARINVERYASGTTRELPLSISTARRTIWVICMLWMPVSLSLVARSFPR